MRLSKILVALDGSRNAELVLPVTVQLTRQNAGTRVVLVRAVDPAILPAEADHDTRAVAINEAAEYLAEVAARLRREGVHAVVRSVSLADPAQAIAEVARTVNTDLIVMASRRRNHAGRLIPGPIAASVRDQTQRPIVLVAADETPGESGAQQATALSETELVHA